MAYPTRCWGVRQIKIKQKGLHSTLLKSLGELSRRKCVLVLQKKLVVSRNKFQMAANASYPEVVDANRRKAKNPVQNPKDQNKSNNNPIKANEKGNKQEDKER
jgi:hypothetical protein